MRNRLKNATDVSATSNFGSLGTNEQERKLKLVAMEKEAEIIRDEGTGSTLKETKQTPAKRFLQKNRLSSVTKNRTTKQSPPPEELDMTGWTGDYNLSTEVGDIERVKTKKPN